jgi:hypothetical protein
MALGNPEIRQQVEALAIGQSVEFKFHMVDLAQRDAF